MLFMIAGPGLSAKYIKALLAISPRRETPAIDRRPAGVAPAQVPVTSERFAVALTADLVEAAAGVAGYISRSHFNRAYRRAFGVPPALHGRVRPVDQGQSLSRT